MHRTNAHCYRGLSPHTQWTATPGSHSNHSDCPIWGETLVWRCSGDPSKHKNFHLQLRARQQRTSRKNAETEMMAAFFYLRPLVEQFGRDPYSPSIMDIGDFLLKLSKTMVALRVPSEATGRRFRSPFRQLTAT